MQKSATRLVSVICLVVLVSAVLLVASRWCWITSNLQAALFLATLSLAGITGLLFWATYKASAESLMARQLELERAHKGVIDQLVNLFAVVERRMLLAESTAGHPLPGDDWLFGPLIGRVFSHDAAVALRAIDPAVSATVYEAVRRTQTAIASIDHMRHKYYEEMDRYSTHITQARSDPRVAGTLAHQPVPRTEEIKAAARDARASLQKARAALGDTTVVEMEITSDDS